MRELTAGVWSIEATSDDRRRRLCWLVMMCLSLPADEPARLRRMPGFIDELAETDPPACWPS